MSKQVYRTIEGATIPSINPAYWDLELTSNTTVWGKSIGFPCISKGMISKIKLLIITPAAPLDIVVYVTKNGNKVYNFTVKTTDRDTINLIPNIEFDEDDIIGYFFPDDGGVNSALNGTMLIEMEYD